MAPRSDPALRTSSKAATPLGQHIVIGRRGIRQAPLGGPISPHFPPLGGPYFSLWGAHAFPLGGTIGQLQEIGR